LKENMSNKMVLIEGNSATRKRKFLYRGHFILSRSKTRDFRNKSHPGYDWEVEFADGTKQQLGIANRAAAKRVIDAKHEL
jgi:hypothetical protein